MNYAVTFPLTAKQQVIGADAHPFYRWACEVAGEDAAPRWNFHKYLVGPTGELAQVYPSKMNPLDTAIIGEIERLLG